MSNLTVTAQTQAALPKTNDLSTDATIKVVGNTLAWPSDGWYEVQYSDNSNTVSEGGQSASVEPGTYNVINHTTGERFEGIAVGTGNSNPHGISPVPLPTLVSSLAQLISQQNVEVELADPALLEIHQAGDATGQPYTYQDIDGEVFVDGASFTDVRQGQVGDCYLMAALSSIAMNNPSYLQQMITDNGNGTYTVSFGGRLGDITVDDDFAASAGGRVLYSQLGNDSANNELWVAIVEKAYAQGMGGFEPIVGGRANEAISELTGQNDFTLAAPSSFTPTQLQAALANNQSVTASSHSSSAGKKANLASGIISSHAYVVTDLRQQADGEWQVEVYNPWGSDTSTNDGTNDGLTWVTWDEFEANFRQVQVMNVPIADAT